MRRAGRIIIGIGGAHGEAERFAFIHELQRHGRMRGVWLTLATAICTVRVKRAMPSLPVTLKRQRPGDVNLSVAAVAILCGEQVRRPVQYGASGCRRPVKRHAAGQSV
jgi:hypothetical protein